MSSSSRRVLAPRALVAAAVVACLPGVAAAADTYFTPTVSVKAENHSNRALAPDNEPSRDLTGYTAELDLKLGVRTPQSTTDFRPRLRFQQFPDEKDLDRTEGSIDLRHTYETQRATLELVARASRRDEYNAQFVDGSDFDEFDPGNPGTGSDGRVFFSERRTQLEFRPKFDYELSQRTSIGTELRFLDVNYDADGPSNKRDYRNMRGEIYLTRKLDQTLLLEGGVYASRYKTDDDTNKTDAIGMSARLRKQWSPAFQADLTLEVEEATRERGNPATFKRDSTEWSLMGGLMWRGQISRVRLSAGRSQVPSGNAERVKQDEIRIRVERNLSPRLELTAVLRGVRERSNLSALVDADRDFARGELALEWRMTRTWFVKGGASYTWQDRKIATDSAKNRSLFLTVGYRGLAPQAAR